jgi:predicted nucleotidyltransferase component of viral defense system
VISKKVVDRYAHQSGVRDQLVAEREVVLTYALGLLRDHGALDQFAFKGGTCLRKFVFGSTGRFSEDLDFTLRTDDEQAALTALYEAFNRNHHGIQFSLDECYETDDGFGMEVRYMHDWNSSGKFRLQVSAREKPTLPVTARPKIDEVYFRDLELEPFNVPTLEPVEMAAEEVRAAFQRAKVRDSTISSCWANRPSTASGSERSSCSSSGRFGMRLSRPPSFRSSAAATTTGMTFVGCSNPPIAQMPSPSSRPSNFIFGRSAISPSSRRPSSPTRERVRARTSLPPGSGRRFGRASSLLVERDWSLVPSWARRRSGEEIEASRG